MRTEFTMMQKAATEHDDDDTENAQLTQADD